MDLRDYLRVVRKRWVTIALLTLLGLAGATVATVLSPQVYTASAQSFVAITNADNSAGNILSGATFTLQRVKSYTQIVDSPEVLQPVIDELHLTVTTQQLAPTVTATSPLDTVLIEVSVKDSSAKQAALVADAVAKQLGSVIENLEKPNDGTASPVKVSLVHPADVPTSPSSPRTLVNIALGLLIGLALGLAYAFIREALDTRITSVEEVSEIHGSAPLGMIPFDADMKNHPLVSLTPQSDLAEAFRAIRTNLQFVDVDNPPKVVVVTSSMPGEGKTVTSCNLAIAVAQTGLRVALVEGDLRRPTISGILKIEGSVGLTDVLSGAVPLKEAIVGWNRGLVAVLPSGGRVPNPSELLGSHAMKALLEFLRENFDLVIIDAPPLLPVTDAAVIANAADGALVVVREGQTTREQLTRALGALEQADASILGTVVNFVPTTRSGHDGYGYGYGYKAEDETSKGRRRSRTEGARGSGRSGCRRSGSGDDDADGSGVPGAPPAPTATATATTYHPGGGLTPPDIPRS